MELIETPAFTKQMRAEISDEEYRVLQLHLMLCPDAGVIIPGTRGLRKLRWNLPGRGKRGGARIIYFWKSAAGRIFLLYLYAKNVRADLSQLQLRILRDQVSDD